VENSLYLMTLGPRHTGFSVLSNTHITPEGARALADATENCWQAIQNLDIEGFGRTFRASFEAQIAMFPNMMNETVEKLIRQYQGVALGWKLSGAGGGGYLILVSDRPIDGAVRVAARRESD